MQIASPSDNGEVGEVGAGCAVASSSLSSAAATSADAPASTASIASLQFVSALAPDAVNMTVLGMYSGSGTYAGYGNGILLSRWMQRIRLKEATDPNWPFRCQIIIVDVQSDVPAGTVQRITERYLNATYLADNPIHLIIGLVTHTHTLSVEGECHQTQRLSKLAPSASRPATDRLGSAIARQHSAEKWQQPGLYLIAHPEPSHRVSITCTVSDVCLVVVIAPNQCGHQFSIPRTGWLTD